MIEVMIVLSGEQKCKGTILVILCWVCVIFFARVVVSERLRRARRGVRGGPLGPPSGGAGGRSPPRGGSGAAPPKKKFWADIFPGPHDIRWFSAHGFCRWFSISG
jgi:hypothetical protein